MAMKRRLDIYCHLLTIFFLSVTITEGETRVKDIMARFVELSSNPEYVEKINKVMWKIDSIFANTSLQPNMNELSDIIDRVTSKYNLMLSLAVGSPQAETITDFAEFALSMDKNAIQNLLERLHQLVVGNDNESAVSGIGLLELIANHFKIEKYLVCATQQSAQMVLFHFYITIILIQLKAFRVLEFSWMLLDTYDKGNFVPDIQLAKIEYEQRAHRYRGVIKDAMTDIDRHVWRCDPDVHKKGETFEQLTLVRGYIENGVEFYPDKYFSLREVLSNVKKNYVVTGLRFRKINGIVHLQIQEGELLKWGTINATLVHWVPIKEFKINDGGVRNGVDYHTLNLENRRMNTDDLEDHANHVVTGVKLLLLGQHLTLSIRFTEADFLSTADVLDVKKSKWKHNDVHGRTLNKLYRPDIPTLTTSKSLPTTLDNQYVEFTNSDLELDPEQSTVPFLDIQDVVSIRPVPLSGAGIYHKGQLGFGGFIAPRLITKDIAQHFYDWT